MSSRYTITRDHHAELIAEIAIREAELVEAEAMISRYDAEIAARDIWSDDQTPFRHRRSHAKAAAYARSRIAAVTTFLGNCIVEPAAA